MAIIIESKRFLRKSTLKQVLEVFMKYNIRLLWIVIIVTITGFTMVSCGDGSKSIDTKTLNNTSYTWSDGAKSYELIISETGAKAAVTSGSFVMIITKSDNTVACFVGTAEKVGGSIKLIYGTDTVKITINASTLTVDGGSNTFGSTTITGGADLKEESGSTVSNNPFIGTWKYEGTDPVGGGAIVNTVVVKTDFTWELTSNNEDLQFCTYIIGHNNTIYLKCYYNAYDFWDVIIGKLSQNKSKIMATTINPVDGSTSVDDYYKQ
jgi:hypothetical protein